MPKHRQKGGHVQYEGSFICGVILIIFFIYGSLRTIKYAVNYIREPEIRVCYTAMCNESGSQIVTKMNTAVNPCSDFYQFACGGHVASAAAAATTTWQGLEKRIDADLESLLREPVSNNDPKAFKAAKNFFSACTNVQAIDNVSLKPMADLIKKLGSWQITLIKKSGTSPARMITELLARDLAVLFSITNKWLLAPNGDWVHNITISHPPVTRTKPMPGQAASELAKFLNNNTLYNENINSALAAPILDFERKLNAMVDDQDCTPFQLNDCPSDSIRTMSISKWQEEYDNKTKNLKYKPAIVWLNMTRTLYGSHINNETLVSVQHDHFNRLLTLVNDTGLEKMTDFLIWRLMSAFGLDSNANLRRIFAEPASSESRERYCVKLIKNNGPLSVALAKMYAYRSVEEYAEQEVRNMVRNIRTTFSEQLAAATWLDAGDKMAAMAKLGNLTENLINPPWPDDSKYKDLVISPDKHVENLMNLASFTATWARANKPLLSATWSAWPLLEPNPDYSYRHNAIYVPAVLLRPPFYFKGAPAAVNYGGIGSLVARQMAKSLDESGCKYAGNGVAIAGDQGLLSKDGSSTFKEKLDCFAWQGQGGHVSDYSGLKLVSAAYQKHVMQNKNQHSRLDGLTNYTAEQMMFIVFAQQFCGVQDRGIGALANLAEFTDEFKCPVGPMNRELKCELW